MKTKILNIIGALLIACGFASCNSENTGSVDVSGSCLVEEFVLNGQYEGTINIEKRLIKIKVPADFNQKSDMQITSLVVPAGAKTNLKAGDRNVLFVLPANSDNIFLSSRNLPYADVITVDEINTYAIVKANTLVMVDGVQDILAERKK